MANFEQGPDKLVGAMHRSGFLGALGPALVAILVQSAFEIRLGGQGNLMSRCEYGDEDSRGLFNSVFILVWTNKHQTLERRGPGPAHVQYQDLPPEPPG